MQVGTKLAGEYDTGLTREVPDPYESLDSLKVASSALMPPFKTVRVQKEGPSLKKSCITMTEIICATRTAHNDISPLAKHILGSIDGSSSPFANE